MRRVLLLCCIFASSAVAIVCPPRLASAQENKALVVDPTHDPGRRMALVLGNKNYPWAPLANPINDANDVAAALERDGFAPANVKLLTDVTARELRHGIAAFLAQVRQDDFVFVYYSGHGYEMNGTNYLIPVDLARDADESDIAHDAYSAQEILRQLNDKGVATKVMVLDACRNNPLHKSSRDLSGGGGLARMDGLGTLVVFATEEGRTASDNTQGRNGLFTQYLLKALAMQGTSFDIAMTLAARQMANDTNRRQIPALYGLLQQPVVLIDAPSVAANFAVAAPVAPPRDESSEAWNLIKDSHHPEDFDDFLHAYPNSPYARAAALAAGRFRRDMAANPAPAPEKGSDAPVPPKKVASTNGALLWEEGHDLDVKKQYDQALPLYRQACEAGEMRGCTWLARLYELAHGVHQDYGVAVALYQKSCDAGEMAGCNNLGIMYDNGDGVAKDTGQAVAFFKKTCDGGEMRGCFNLGTMYDNGNGVAQDAVQAVALYKKACDGGEMRGCSNLGTMYENGDGVAQDAGQAVALYKKACDGGVINGCAGQGWYLTKGIGVAVDRLEGIRLLHKSCDAGSSWACDRLKELGEK